jgi:dephospho-CoA kinase
MENGHSENQERNLKGPKQFGVMLAGGICVGKSTIAQYLRGMGHRVIDADELAKDVVRPGTPGLLELKQAFGKDILSECGSLDRQRMREKLLASDKAKKTLESIIHPRIRSRLDEIIDQFKGIWFYEAALGIETGHGKEFRAVWLVRCDPEEQISRIMVRDQITRDVAKQRVLKQWSEERARPFADQVIDTSNPEWRTQVNKLLRELLG